MFNHVIIEIDEKLSVILGHQEHWHIYFIKIGKNKSYFLDEVIFPNLKWEP